MDIDKEYQDAIARAAEQIYELVKQEPNLTCALIVAHPYIGRLSTSLLTVGNEWLETEVRDGQTD